MVLVTVFAQWEFRIPLARRTMYMGTLCAMETIHLLDKESEVESERRVPEKPREPESAASSWTMHRRRRAAVSKRDRRLRSRFYIVRYSFEIYHMIDTLDKLSTYCDNYIIVYLLFLRDINFKHL